MYILSWLHYLAWPGDLDLVVVHGARGPYICVRQDAGLS